MLVESAKIMPITRLQKELTQTVRKISEDKEPVYVMKNNVMAAVLLPFDKYEYFSKLEELIEHYEIYEMVKTRMADYDETKMIPWDSVKD